ncbi:MAG: HAMP domain-containing histidine kinase [Tannerella sp.]|jgi:two-component system phosphate regulon sensor histidine kinase PhoR|nr:HAMP domain-containing histidine kinase [Tannerella sp.]
MNNITGKRIWGVAIVAIILLLLLQSLWLYHSYRMQKQELRGIVNELLSSSVNKELNIRYDKFTSPQKTAYNTDNRISIDTIRLEYREDMEKVKEVSFLQHILRVVDKPFNIIVLDSIFNSELEKSGITARYSLLYTDSTGNLLENAGNLKNIDSKGLIKTDSSLIVDGKKVEAVVDIAIPVIFKRMIVFLVLSLLVILFLIFLFYYQTKTLFTQQKMNQLRTDFVYALIHNFKSPLHTVALKLSYLKAGAYPTGERQKIAIQEALEANGKVLKLTERTLAMARLEDKKLTLNRSQTDVNALISRIASEYRDFPGKKVFIKINACSPDIVADVDSELMEDVLRNLMDNAVKYSGDPVDIEINCFVSDNQLIISLKDDGDGISPQAQTTVMEKFERGDASGKKGMAGLGLGLYYVKQVMEAHGGDVALESEKGKGTAVSLLIPLKIPLNDMQPHEIQPTNENDTVTAD